MTDIQGSASPTQLWSDAIAAHQLSEALAELQATINERCRGIRDKLAHIPGETVDIEAPDGSSLPITTTNFTFQYRHRDEEMWSNSTSPVLAVGSWVVEEHPIPPSTDKTEYRPAPQPPDYQPTPEGNLLKVVPLIVPIETKVDETLREIEQARARKAQGPPEIPIKDVRAAIDSLRQTSPLTADTSVQKGLV